MNGTYGYLDGQWYWKVEIMGEEVASGHCKHKGEIQKVIDKHPACRWKQDTDQE